MKEETPASDIQPKSTAIEQWPVSKINLRAMATLIETCGIKAGFSDHTAGKNISLAAAALGASMIEKHITLDRNSMGPDHAASPQPEEFKIIVDGVR